MHSTNRSQQRRQRKRQLKAMAQVVMIGAAFLTALPSSSAAPTSQTDSGTTVELTTESWARNFANVESPHPLSRRHHGDIFGARQVGDNDDGLSLHARQLVGIPVSKASSSSAAATTVKSTSNTSAAVKTTSSIAPTTSIKPTTTSSSSLSSSSSSTSSSSTTSAPSSSTTKAASSTTTSSLTSSMASSTSVTSATSSSATASATATAAASKGFTLTDTSNKLFPLWVTLFGLALLAGLFVVLCAVRWLVFPAKKKDQDEATHYYGASSDGTAGGAVLTGRGHKIGSGAKSLRKALTTRKLAGSSFARRKGNDPSVWLEVGDEVVAVPTEVASEYRKLRVQHGQNASGWDSRASLSHAWERYDATTATDQDAKPLPEDWNQSALTLVSGSAQKAAKAKRGLSTRVANRLRALRGTQQTGEDKLGEPEKTTDLNTFLPVVTKGSEGGWAIQSRSEDADADTSLSVVETPTQNKSVTSGTMPISAAPSQISSRSSQSSQGFSLEDTPSSEARARTTARRVRPASGVQPAAAASMSSSASASSHASDGSSSRPPSYTSAPWTGPTSQSAYTGVAQQGHQQRPRVASHQTGFTAPATGRDRLREMRLGQGAVASGHPQMAPGQYRQSVAGYPVAASNNMSDPRMSASARMQQWDPRVQQYNSQGQPRAASAYYPASAVQAQMMYQHQQQQQQQQRQQQQQAPWSARRG